MSKNALLIALRTLLLISVASVSFGDVIIPGLSSSHLDDKLKALVLIEELNCAACHTGDASLTTRSKKAPRLSEVGSRLNPEYIEAFIRDPHETKPGNTMPDALIQLGKEEKKQAAKSLT